METRMHQSTALVMLLLTLCLSVHSCNMRPTEGGSSASCIAYCEDEDRIIVCGVYDGSRRSLLDRDTSLGRFMESLDASGGILDYQYRIDGTSAIYTSAVCADPSCGIYMVGSLAGRLCALDESADLRATTMGPDCYIQALRMDGTSRWVRSFGGNGEDVCLGVVCSDINEIFVVGGFEDTFSVELGNGNRQSYHSEGLNDAFICALGFGGKLSWLTTFGGSGNDVAFSIATDRVGALYVTGYFEDNVTIALDSSQVTAFSSGDRDAFLCKLDCNGAIQWFRHWGGEQRDMAMDVAADGEGHVYVTGSFKSVIDMDPGSNETLVMSNGQSDAFLSKFDHDGNFIEAYTWGGESKDEAFAVAVGEDMIAATGWFRGGITVDMAQGPTRFEATGESDGLVLSWDNQLQLQWVQPFGGAGNFRDIGRDLVVDGEGRTLVAGTDGLKALLIAYDSTGNKVLQRKPAMQEDRGYD